MAHERLPSVRKLAADINRVRTQGKNSVRKSADYLHSKAGQLAQHGSVEDLVAAELEGDELARSAIFHFTSIRAELARELWSRRVFLGPETLDRLLFRAVAVDRAEDPVLRCLEIVRDRQLARAGMVVFPVHSFGLLAGGLLSFTHRRPWIFSPPDSRIALFPQTNRWSRTLETLDEARGKLGVRKQLPLELLEHWRRSRPVGWLKKNPIMAVAVSTAPGSYYDTEPLVMGRLRAASALVCLLAAVQPRNEVPGASLLSSARVNNWETLNIHHYLNLFDSPADRRALGGDCVPIGLRKAELAEISELNIEIDPRHWGSHHRTAGRFAQAARDAVDRIYDGYMRHAWLRGPSARPDARSQAYTKLHDSLIYFRRSFHTSDQGWSQIVSLAVAFEMMLTDGSNTGPIATKLQRRVRLLLRGRPGVRRYSEVVHDLYKHRNEVVHAGNVPVGIDLTTARHCFALCVVELAGRSTSLDPTTTQPMRDLIGDTRTQSRAKACSHCGR
ncbi:hypothetical protein ACFWOL_29905 [Streptomyces sp. NPDC058442]|uniref:hypothetical protein n=1 Tax=Streptomyces sp. NPDC058442 TaxID=3346503 RepID=UPI00364EFFE1